jgi:PPK2 family polyphosphate:nucleotide phosphotransferase
MKLHKILKRFRVDHPHRFRIADCDPRDTCGLSLDKDSARPLLDEGVKRLADLQHRLYADDRWALLVVFQGMDAAGKDSAIKHVMSGINPQGCEVHPFRTPSSEELDHDFLWRASVRLPARGRIGIFNRSYYEEVLIARARPDVLADERLPRIGKHVWKQRFNDIRAFERHLTRSGTAVLKFYLHMSKEEQRQRLLARLDDPKKRWKFSTNDIRERGRWENYMAAYEDMIRATSRPQAPWYVVPADNKWFAWILVAEAMVDALDALDLEFPVVRGKALAEQRKVRRALEAEGRRK